jgi:hypothetical protein
MRIRGPACLLILCAAALPAPSIAARQASPCELIESATDLGKSSKAVAIVPERLLADWMTALPCLVQIVEKLGQVIDSPRLNADVQKKFLSTTGALRSIIARLTAGDQAGEGREMQRFVGEFRRLDNLTVTAALAFGARSDDRDVRLNAMLVLANVVDDSTLCVPLDHLYDPGINPSGRANLLGVVSVVAPWAYAESFKNIEAMYRMMTAKTKGSPEFRQTNDILDNIRKRLDYQTATSNKNVPIPAEEAAGCKSYKMRWAGADLKY